MEITKEQNAHITDHILKHIPRVNCDCGHPNYVLSQDILMLPKFRKGIQDFTGQYPVVVMRCKTCSQLKFFAADGIGVPDL